MISIFLGKGGVGKSTLACALATAKKEEITLFSADPMSNLWDILGRDIPGNITVKELDLDKAVERYLKSSVDEIRKAYSYLSALNLDSMLDAINFTPGIEEHVILLEIEKVLDGEVIIDMPPAGLALRVLGLPSAEEGWLNALMELRRKIVERRRALAKISGADEEKDKALERLELMKNRASELKRKLLASRVYVVSTKESLSEAEAERIEKALDKLGFRYKRVYNMCEGEVPKLPFEPKGSDLSLLEVEKWL